MKITIVSNDTVEIANIKIAIKSINADIITETNISNFKHAYLENNIKDSDLFIINYKQKDGSGSDIVNFLNDQSMSNFFIVVYGINEETIKNEVTNLNSVLTIYSLKEIQQYISTIIEDCKYLNSDKLDCMIDKISTYL